jgi:hypothetical protein
LGLRGPQSTNVAMSERRAIDDLDITDEAITIYRKMRALEKRNDGPGDDKWCEMNAKLAECLGLFPGMVVYEDPSWQYNRPSPSGLIRFPLLEAAAKRSSKKENKYKYKWER